MNLLLMVGQTLMKVEVEARTSFWYTGELYQNSKYFLLSSVMILTNQLPKAEYSWSFAVLWLFALSSQQDCWWMSAVLQITLFP